MSRRGITDSDTTRCSCPRYLNSNARSVRRFPKRRTRFPIEAMPFVNFAQNCPKTRRKSAILIRLFGCRDVAQPGSAPALGAGCRRFESCRPDQSRVWFNGRTEAFQASNAGSIPVTRSNKTSDQSLIGSDFLFVRQSVRQVAGQMRAESERNFRPCCVGSCVTRSCVLSRAQPLKCASDHPKVIADRSAILLCVRSQLSIDDAVVGITG